MKKWFVFSLTILIIIVAAGLFYKQLLTLYAEFYTVNNASKGADAIVVLSGEQATRIPHALKLHSENYASEILLTDVKKLEVRFAHLFPTNELIAEAMIEELKIDVTFSTVPSLKGGATSTFDEAYDLRKYSEQKGFQHLILLTDAYHTRRAYHAFKTVFTGSDIKLEMAAAPNNIFNENNWWTSDRGISAYVLESIKYPVYLMSTKNAAFIRND